MSSRKCCAPLDALSSSRTENLTVNAACPTGAFHKGGTYGPDTNFPLPQSEDNNPNVTAAKANGTLDARGCFPNTI